MIYKKVEIKVEGYQETADLYTLFWTILWKCVRIESARSL